MQAAPQLKGWVTGRLGVVKPDHPFREGNTEPLIALKSQISTLVSNRVKEGYLIGQTQPGPEEQVWPGSKKRRCLLIQFSD